MSQNSFPAVPGWVKYVVISILGAITSILAWYQSQPAGGITALTFGGFIVALILHDIEGYNPNAPVTNAQVIAAVVSTYEAGLPLALANIKKLPAADQQVALVALQTAENALYAKYGIPNPPVLTLPA